MRDWRPGSLCVVVYYLDNTDTLRSHLGTTRLNGRRTQRSEQVRSLKFTSSLCIKTGSSEMILCLISSRACEICFLVSLPVVLKGRVEMCCSREGGGAVVQMAAHLFVLLFCLFKLPFLKQTQKAAEGPGTCLQNVLGKSRYLA